jgi:hypothetical protein
VEKGKKDLVEVVEEFEKSNVELQHLDHKVANTKVWVRDLVQQIQLMVHGDIWHYDFSSSH